MSGGMRQRWHHRGAFLSTLVVAGFGLGALWTLPAALRDHGGGAFLIAWLCCLLLLGLPLLMLETAVGVCYQVGLAEALRRTARRWHWVGIWGLCLLVLSCFAGLLSGAWLMVHIGRTIHLFLTGAVPADPVPDEGLASADATPSGPVVAGLAIFAAIVGAAAARGPAPWGIILVRVLPTLAALAILGVLAAIGGGGGVVGLEVLAAPRWEALLLPQTWLTAARQAAFGLLLGLGVVSVLASHRHRSSDASGPGVVAIAASALGQCALALSLGILALRVELAAGPDLAHSVGMLSWHMRDPLAAVDPAQARGGALMVLLVLAAALSLLWAAMTTMVLGLVGAWNDRFGGSRVRQTVGVLFVLVVAALPLASRQGLWWLAALVEGLAVYGVPLVALALSLVFVRRIGTSGLEDHFRAYGSLPVGSAWKLALGTAAPLVLALAAVATAVEQLADGSAGLPGILVLLAGVIPIAAAPLVALVLQELLRRSVRQRLAVLRLLLLVLFGGLIIAVVAVAWPHRETRRIRADLETAIEDLRLRRPWAEAGGVGHPLEVAQRAWSAGLRDEARRAVELLLRGDLQHGDRMAAAAWARALRNRGISLVRGGQHDVEVLEILRLLRLLQADKERFELQALIDDEGWFPDWRAVALAQSSTSLLGLTFADDGDGALAEIVAAATFGGRTLPLPLLGELPDPAGRAAVAAVEALRLRLDTLLGEAYAAQVPPAEREQTLRELSQVLVRCGLWQDIEPLRRRYLAELRAGGGGERAALILLGIVVLALLVTLQLGIRGSGRGPRPVDPLAETLENVEPIDVDTEAVTWENVNTTGATPGLTTSGTTTPGAMTTEVERPPVE